MKHINLMTNEELVLSLQKEMNNEYFRELKSRFNPMVRKYAYSYYIDQFEYEDFNQEADIIIWKAIKRFDGDKVTYFAPYYHQMYRNHLLNLIRKDNAACRNNGQSVIYLDCELEDNDVSLGDILFDQQHSIFEIIEIKEQSSKYVESLSFFEKQLFYEYIHTSDYYKIAENLNIPKRKVHDGIYRCHKKLKNILNNERG